MDSEQQQPVAGARSFRLLMLACAVAVAIGLLMIIVGQQLPAYRVPYQRALDAFQAWCTDEPRRDDVAGARYLSMFGRRYLVLNVGVGLISTAIPLAMLAAVLRQRAGSDWCRTPAASWQFIVLGLLALAVLLPGVVFGLATDARRQYFPWCADSIGIPIFALTMVLTVAAPTCAILGLIITMLFGRLPVHLGIWDRSRPVRSFLVTLIFGGAAAAIVVIWAIGLTSSDVVGPSTVLIVYLLASTRAALLAPPSRNKERNAEAGENALAA